jgi:hypothetical protein
MGLTSVFVLRFCVTVFEALDTTLSVDDFLRARVERVAGATNLDRQGGQCGTGLDDVAANAVDFDLVVFGVNFRSHSGDTTPVM